MNLNEQTNILGRHMWKDWLIEGSFTIKADPVNQVSINGNQIAWTFTEFHLVTMKSYQFWY